MPSPFHASPKRNTSRDIQSVHYDNSPVRPYRRELDLVRLIPLWPRQIADNSSQGTELIVKLLEKALRSERCRGKAGHWTYSLSRHKALKDALEAENKQLKTARLFEHYQQQRKQTNCPAQQTDTHEHDPF